LIPGKARDIAELLVTNGADVNALDLDSSQTPLFNSISSHHEDVFEILLKYDTDCKAHDSKGDTPLHIALQQYTISGSKVKALIDNGANPKAKNQNGEAALHVMSHAATWRHSCYATCCGCRLGGKVG
jgi:ankyrin repeat protein